MSKIVLYPANGFDFDAADVAAYLAGLTSGVFSGDEDFPVTAAGGLKVTVGAGRGWVHPSRFTGYSITKREADTLTLPLADPSLPRIDRIVMRYDAGARAASLQVLQGTASSTPTAPAISRTELIYDLCLAEITRPAGSTSITTGQITDTRLDEALCGLVRDGVTGIPTDELLAAATSELNAAGSASASAGSAAAAARSQSAAAGSATEASGSASAAEKSKTAAATSESNAAKHEEAAKKASDEAGAKAGTDKTLSIENAPADAAAVRKLIEESLAAQRAEDYARIKFWASNDSTSPASFIGGTWERIEGEFIMGASDAYPAGTTGGSATHTQTVAEMPSHNHSGSTGSAGSHIHSAWTGGAGGHNHTVSAAIANKNGPMMAGENSGYGQYADNGTPTTSWVGDHTHGVGMNEAGAHTHTVSIGSTGSGQAMSILNPYYALYIWVRVDDAA